MLYIYLLTQCPSSLTSKNRPSINTVGYIDCSGRLRHSLIIGNNLLVILIPLLQIFCDHTFPLHVMLYFCTSCYWRTYLRPLLQILDTGLFDFFWLFEVQSFSLYLLVLTAQMNPHLSVKSLNFPIFRLFSSLSEDK